MKNLLIIIIILFSIAYTQCDANEDGNLNIQDVVINVNCILEDCWESDTTYTCIDIEGNIYETIQIGEQWWMAENLKVTKFRNGSYIPTGYSNDQWSNLETPAYAIYNNNQTHADTYGNLYNGYIVDDDRGICPENWHIPTNDEFLILIDYLGGSVVAGGALKECLQGYCPSSNYWNNPNTGATNSSGFSALPGGHRSPISGTYYGESIWGYFWTSTSSINNAYEWYVGYNDIEAFNSNSMRKIGLSIRCLQD